MSCRPSFILLITLFKPNSLKPIRIVFFVLIAIISSFCSSKSNSNNNPAPPPPPPPPPPVYEWLFETTPVWSDEFNTDGLPDASKWGYDVGGTGWGNNELQYYTNALNATVSNGKLKIEARKENYSGKSYTSARMVTKNKADWLYGRFEIKARLPKGRGSWPAIWMLPTEGAYGSWPGSGEIDIMEHVGYDQNRVHITVHTKAYNHTLGTQKSANTTVPTASDDFHLYRVDWTSYGIRGFIDGQQIFEFLNDKGGGSDFWPFDRKFHLLLNVAVGGNWGGAQGVDDSIFPTSLEVDYVKVFKFIR
jgi:beta-glucanase (GH16 family)